MSIKPTVLYVDDEQDNLFAFRSVFRRFYNVVTALSGKEAIELMEKQQIQVVLSDQRMPNMTGVELCDYIGDHYPSAVCVIVTGYSEKAPIFDAIQKGSVRQMIVKPWDVKELRSLIDQMLINPS